MMKIIHFPKPFSHDHPPIQDVNIIIDERRTIGQRSSDWVARIVGSWKFIIFQSIILFLWVIMNISAWIRHWDPYPFILMNLVLSLQAAYTAPIIMMSQNRQAERDRIEARNDYLVNQKAEKEIREIIEHLSAQNEALKQIHHIVINSNLRRLKNEENI